MRSVALSWLGKGHFVPQLLAVLALLSGAPQHESSAAVLRGPGGVQPSPLPSRSSAGSVVLQEQAIEASASPLAGLSPKQIQELVANAPERLGPAVVGRPNRGSLWNALALQSGPGLEVMNEERCFGTRATLDSLAGAVAEVRAQFPDMPRLRVGDISREHGGYVRPHRSHQTGLDADVGYLYVTDARWYTRANAENLDREKTWALIKALIAQGTVEYLFMDRSIQALLRDHAIKSGEPEAWVSGLFANGPQKEALIRHTWGHITHFHVRFMDPTAEDTGRRLAPYVQRLARAVTKPKVTPRRVQAKASKRR